MTYLSRRFMLKTYLNLTDEEIELNEKLLKEERANLDKSWSEISYFSEKIFTSLQIPKSYYVDHEDKVKQISINPNYDYAMAIVKPNGRS